MVAYFRARSTLWSAAALMVGGILTAWDAAVVAPGYMRQYAVRNDFRLDFSAALIGLHQGYGHLYDLAVQQSTIRSLGAGFNVQPFISPPPLAWLVTPLTPLPFVAALAVWTVLLLAALVWTWHLVAPGEGWRRFGHLLLWLGVFPVAFGVLVGQPGALVAAVVATTWWLIRRERQVAAGLVLSLLVIKPQLALLVPLCLLAGGYRRAFAAWLGASALIGVVALALLGADGVSRYRDALAMTQGPAWAGTRLYSISGPLGLGPLLNVAQVAVLLLAVVAAWRHRAQGPEIPIAAGIAGSLLFSPYLAFQDLLMLVVAAWLVIRAGASAAQVALLVAGYALLEMSIPVLALPTLVAEACLLLSLLLSKPRRRPIESAHPAPDEPLGAAQGTALAPNTPN